MKEKRKKQKAQYDLLPMQSLFVWKFSSYFKPVLQAENNKNDIYKYGPEKKRYAMEWSIVINCYRS